MTWEQIIGLSLALVIMLAGLIGSILPGLPGTPLVLLAAIGHRLYFGATSASNVVLIVLVVLTVGSVAFDYAATALGAKKFGASWWGALGATVGGLIGLFFALPGIILGPLVGATFLELLAGKKFQPALKAGAGAVLGLLLGVVGKFSICVVMIVLFAVSVISSSV